MAKRRCAVFTLAKDEAINLPIWVTYYRQFFSAADIYVLDHQSQDGSTDRLDCNVIEVQHDTFQDIAWVIGTVECFQRELLHKYEYVIFCDPDEIVFTVNGLANYIEDVTAESVQCTGYELVHNILIDRDRSSSKPIEEYVHHIESPLDLSQPILKQRRLWSPSGLYSKVALARKHLMWVPGFHFIKNRQPKKDPDLLMIHLHRMDFGMAHERHRIMRDYKWSQRALSGTQGTHLREADNDEFLAFFHALQPNAQEIPSEVRDAGWL